MERNGGIVVEKLVAKKKYGRENRTDGRSDIFVRKMDGGKRDEVR